MSYITLPLLPPSAVKFWLHCQQMGWDLCLRKKINYKVNINRVIRLDQRLYIKSEKLVVHTATATDGCYFDIVVHHWRFAAACSCSILMLHCLHLLRPLEVLPPPLSQTTQHTGRVSLT